MNKKRHFLFCFLLLGSAPDNLDYPSGLYYDEINQDLYISNGSVAYTIMRWHIGDTNGTVIAGVSGVQGSNATLLISSTRNHIRSMEEFICS